MRLRTVATILSAASLAACIPGSASTGPGSMSAPQAVPRAVPASASYRVVETASGNPVTFSTLVERAAASDVVFFGEQHDDPETHFLEFALLEGIGQRRSHVVLSLEMFERDVQQSLDRYLTGAASESTFLAGARPWPRYATDYRPMVLLARARGWPVIAANIPRPMASAISRRGMRALDTLTAAERGYAASTMSCPLDDEYYRRFAAEMSGHSAGGGPPTAADSAAALQMTVRFYEAQCAKDETMAESIARGSGRGEITLHVNGAFHSDYGQGTAERVVRRRPEARTLVITAVPVDNPATAVLGMHAGKADYVIFTRAPRSGG